MKSHNWRNIAVTQPDSERNRFHEKAGQAAEQEHAREEHRFQDILIARLHHAGSTAVCFSGGGIRSATFGLGALQELARRSDPFFLCEHPEFRV